MDFASVPESSVRELIREALDGRGYPSIDGDANFPIVPSPLAEPIVTKLASQPVRVLRIPSDKVDLVVVARELFDGIDDEHVPSLFLKLRDLVSSFKEPEEGDPSAPSGGREEKRTIPAPELKLANAEKKKMNAKHEATLRRHVRAVLEHFMGPGSTGKNDKCVSCGKLPGSKGCSCGPVCSVCGFDHAAAHDLARMEHERISGIAEAVDPDEDEEERDELLGRTTHEKLGRTQRRRERTGLFNLPPAAPEPEEWIEDYEDLEGLPVDPGSIEEPEEEIQRVRDVSYPPVAWSLADEDEVPDTWEELEAQIQQSAWEPEAPTSDVEADQDEDEEAALQTGKRKPPAHELTRDPEGWPIHKWTLNDVADYLETSLQNATIFVDTLRRKFLYLADLDQEESLDVVLPAINDYIQTLAKEARREKGDPERMGLSMEDILELEDAKRENPQIFLELDSFREFLSGVDPVTGKYNPRRDYVRQAMKTENVPYTWQEKLAAQRAEERRAREREKKKKGE